MESVRLEHFITSTHAATIEEQLDRYRQAGFLPEATTVKHDPGLRNGFVMLGPEYLELAWVEDEAQFAAGGGSIPDIQTYHPAMRPWGIGLEVADVEAAHEQWHSRGYALPPIFSRGVRDADPGAGPAWSFQPIPRDLLPGAHCFALTYHTSRREQARTVRIAPNTVYAIDGITLVAADPRARALCWGTFLAPHAPIEATDDAAAVHIGPHVVNWLTPQEYRRRYGRAWQEAPHDRGEIAQVHLLAENLGVAEAAFVSGGFTVERLRRTNDEPDTLLVGPVPQDGSTFLVTEEQAEAWAQRRHSLTGEELAIAR